MRQAKKAPTKYQIGMTPCICLTPFICSIIKREDEKRVTERAWNNPKFVEGSVRDLANTLKNEPRIVWFRCSSENFESIHNHNAHAEIEFDKALG